MMALLAKKDEKCAFQLDSVEAGDGPGAMCVTGLQFKYDSSKELLRDSTLTIHAYRRYGLIGRNGEGKSSLLRALLPALVAVVRRFLHPECLGGFVKQTLNKPLAHLALEFDRRPNNNDLSVVTVVETAREPLTASEPRLLLLGLEEMPDVVQRPDATKPDATKHECVASTPEAAPEAAPERPIGEHALAHRAADRDQVVRRRIRRGQQADREVAAATAATRVHLPHALKEARVMEQHLAEEAREQLLREAA